MKSEFIARVTESYNWRGETIVAPVNQEASSVGAGQFKKQRRRYLNLTVLISCLSHLISDGMSRKR